ncbi:MAG: SIMPL domain-containing protein, partial [Acidobacteria bacterium]|nr:SIMPL domain-containing protein [Acidobacteriota bacterium]
MMKPLLLSFLLIFVLHLAAAVSEAQQVELPLITVTGEAEVKVAPDEVVFTLSVVKLDKDLLVAKEQNDQSVRRIMELTRRYNIAQQDVQTNYMEVEPKYRVVRTGAGRVDDDAATRTEFEGYAVSKTVVVRLRDISRFEALFSDIVKAGVDRIRNVNFRTSEMRKHRDQARALAMRAAREKAVAMTKEIGQTIGRAYTISEEGFRYTNSNISANTTSVVGGDYSDEETSTVAPGMITVSA